MKQVRLKITASVTKTFTLKEGQSIDDLKNSDVDIYIHSKGGKIDLGADHVDIRLLIPKP